MTTSDLSTSPPHPLKAYLALDVAELTERINAVRASLGSRLLVLGHHYQRDEVIALSDLRGDSYKLSAMAASNEPCETIAFCGVHFMAETADILANRPERLAQRDGRRVMVVLPDMQAGCPLAEMADIEQVEACWQQLATVSDVDEVTPITYVNSRASLKAFCGRHGGIVCTSSNARAVLEWAFQRRPRVLFFPDQHLGRNTARAMGIPLDAMPLWNPSEPSLGGNTEAAIRDARVLLWRGWCNVHQRFLAEDVARVRRERPGVKVIVHPECMMEVVDQSDAAGSTSMIIEEVRKAAPGTRWAIGTEERLVRRLQEQFPEQEIDLLGSQGALCRTMSLIDLPHVCWTLENLAAGTPVGVVTVDEATAEASLLALERMLKVS